MNINKSYISTIKSYSVGKGDLFFIKCNNCEKVIVDCNLEEEYKARVIRDLNRQIEKNDTVSFISTHPHSDHICGLAELDDTIDINCFYAVDNEAVASGNDEDIERYTELKHYSGENGLFIHKGVSISEARIHFLWPDTNNVDFKEELERVQDGDDSNNLSPIFTYTSDSGVRAMWMGDMQTEFLDKIKEYVDWPQVDILFAPHHGRESGRVSDDVLRLLNPKVIVIGEAEQEELADYDGYNVIHQEQAGDITFKIYSSRIDIFVGNEDYKIECGCLSNHNIENILGAYYAGSIDL